MSKDEDVKAQLEDPKRRAERTRRPLDLWSSLSLDQARQESYITEVSNSLRRLVKSEDQNTEQAERLKKFSGRKPGSTKKTLDRIAFIKKVSLRNPDLGHNKLARLLATDQYIDETSRLWPDDQNKGAVQDKVIAFIYRHSKKIFDFRFSIIDNLRCCRANFSGHIWEPKFNETEVIPMNSHVARTEDLQAESFLRIREVAKRTSLSASTIYREVEKGGFPKPYRLTTNTVAWKASEIRAWMGGRTRNVFQGGRNGQ